MTGNQGSFLESEHEKRLPHPGKVAGLQVTISWHADIVTKISTGDTGRGSAHDRDLSVFRTPFWGCDICAADSKKVAGVFTFEKSMLNAACLIFFHKEVIVRTVVDQFLNGQRNEWGLTKNKSTAQTTLLEPHGG